MTLYSARLPALSFPLVRSIMHAKALARGHKLLEHYQDAIDYGTIVSKADKQGIITYANRAFCEISGYSPKELLHQPTTLSATPTCRRAFFKRCGAILKRGKSGTASSKI